MKTKNKKRLIIFILIVVFVLIGFLIFRKGKEEKKQTEDNIPSVSQEETGENGEQTITEDVNIELQTAQNKIDEQEKVIQEIHEEMKPLNEQEEELIAKIGNVEEKNNKEEIEKN